MKDEIKEIIDKIKKCLIAGYDLDIITQEEMGILWNYITNLQEKYDKALTDLVHESHKRMELESKITNLQEKVNQYENPDDMTLFYMWLDEKAKDKMKQLQEENERLLKTQEMYEKKCNKIHNYILQNCEIIRHKDYDEVGKVNGGHILTLLAGGDDNG